MQLKIRRSYFPTLFAATLFVLAAIAKPVSAQTWVLMWHDEFNGPANSYPDPSKWTYDVGGGGWGNDELETYCAPGSNDAPCNSAYPNAFMDGNGNLVIRARMDSSGNWTSARLKTQGLFSFQYGRIEARIKLTVGDGLWPAFWMLGNDFGPVPWPNCGEDDIMEWVDLYGPSTTSSTSHGPGYSGANGIGAKYTFPNGGRVDDPGYHIYGLMWSPNLLQYYRDDPSHVFLTITPSSIPSGDQWVFNAPFFILLNQAVGGNWFPGPDSTTPNPADMLVDYVRVYQAVSDSSASRELGSLFDPNPIYPGVRTDYVGSDQHVHELFLSDATWQKADLTTITDGGDVSSGTGLAGVVDPAYGNAVRDYYIGSDQHVHELFLSNALWSDGDLTTITGAGTAAAGGKLASLFDPNYNGVRTYYAGTDQHVHELFLSGETWQDADLTMITGATSVSSGTGFATILDPAYSNAVRTYYTGSDQHVHELFLNNGLWQDGDITMLTGGPSAATGSSLASLFDPNYNGVRTYYIGADQHVHELFLSGATWQDGDLINITGGESAATNSSLATLFDPNYTGVRTDYVGADQHVHELFLTGDTWQDADLTSIAGGVAVSSGTGLTGILDPVWNNAVRDYYIGGDQHVHELFLYGGFWHDGDLTVITGGGAAALAGISR
ncbi:MAG: family 16 glycosylhydrolase [Bryobacteraceae bacterium]